MPEIAEREAKETSAVSGYSSNCSRGVGIVLWDKSGSIACAGDPQGGGRHDSSCCYSPTVRVVLAIEELCRAFGRPSGLRQRDPDEMAFFTPS